MKLACILAEWLLVSEVNFFKLGKNLQIPFDIKQYVLNYEKY